MFRSTIALAALAAAVFVGPAPAQTDPGEYGQVPDRDWEARCRMVSRIFHRLGEQRTGSADRQAAVFSVRQWAAQHGDVGSHQKVDYGKSVESAAEFVYAHKDMNKTTLAHFGYRSCALQYAFRDDPLRIEASQMLLLEAAGACQKEHPGDRYNPRLRECMQQNAQAIEARVRKAHIKVKG